ncbi:hypothetical protein FocTR4_00007180 [Fusarium oxysporum f. sp. cubense]|uniref:Uncharacterized protein n=1 Tax=Fusarium oxysporum f. sp. cubense TaxID=61366 RepID=A0A5C6TIR7_FUSOC|nr:hypothetical protein FocTR4_00007180 [Fusarium oxysporum f. sp. cubense]
MTNCRQLRYFSIFEAVSSQQSVIIIVAVVEVTEASCGSSLIDEAPRLVSSCDASDLLLPLNTAANRADSLLVSGAVGLVAPSSWAVKIPVGGWRIKNTSH